MPLWSLDTTSHMLNQRALGLGRDALNAYGSQRAKKESVRQLTEGIYRSMKQAAPELI